VALLALPMAKVASPAVAVAGVPRCGTLATANVGSILGLNSLHRVAAAKPAVNECDYNTGTLKQEVTTTIRRVTLGSFERLFSPGKYWSGGYLRRLPSRFGPHAVYWQNGISVQLLAAYHRGLRFTVYGTGFSLARAERLMLVLYAMA
jgi:hypothetical protein